MEKAIMWHTFNQNGDIQWIWSGGWEWWAVSGVIGRWSWFSLHIYAAKYVYFWILQHRLARHWGAGVIHAGSRRGYLKENSRIELCMVDKGFGGRQYQKTTLASNPKRDYQVCTYPSLWINRISMCEFCQKLLIISKPQGHVTFIKRNDPIPYI